MICVVEEPKDVVAVEDSRVSRAVPTCSEAQLARLTGRTR